MRQSARAGTQLLRKGWAWGRLGIMASVVAIVMTVATGSSAKAATVVPPPSPGGGGGTLPTVGEIAECAQKCMNDFNNNMTRCKSNNCLNFLWLLPFCSEPQYGNCSANAQIVFHLCIDDCKG